VFGEMSVRKHFPKIEMNNLGLDGDGSYNLRVFYWAKMISGKVLKKGS
jgi:hypothetical protein